MAEKKLEYTRDGVTVVWRPDVCIHSAICARGLPAVFDPRARPWIEMTGAPIEDIVSQVHKCPSGAISIRDEE